jgi:hypothetical protein
MNTSIKALVLSACLAGAMLVTINTWSSSNGGNITLIAFAKANFPKGDFPTCFDMNCTASIHRIDVQAWPETGVLLADFWATYNGSRYFASVLRVQSATYWLYVLNSDSTFWHKFVAAWAKGKAGVLGPVALSELQKQPVGVCNQVAPKILIPVTSDAGRLQLPPPAQVCPSPNDAGAPCTSVPQTWPAGSVMRCRDAAATAGGYYLKQLKYGGATAVNYTVDGGVPPGNAQALLPNVPSKWWSQPDAQTTKTCSGIPMGTACP